LRRHPLVMSLLPPRSRRLPAVSGLAGLVLIAACGSSAGSSASPQALLQSAKQTLDSTPGVHFALQSTNAASGGTVIKGGQADLARPDRLAGSLDVLVNGVGATIKVVVVGNTVVAQLPFSTSYTKIDPATFGLGNPADLLNNQHGLSSMLIAGTNPQAVGSERIAGELLQEIRTSIPGSAVPLLPDQDRSRPVVMVAAINPSNHQLRQVTLTGPFVSTTSDSTFTVTLTNYGEHPQITLPPSS
jgi:lipoprotein LprG